MASSQAVRTGRADGSAPHVAVPIGTRHRPARRSSDPDAPTIQLRTAIAAPAPAPAPAPATRTPIKAPAKKPVEERAARTKTTTVAVLVPAHDEEEGIAATVEGLLAQDVPEWLRIAEVVVVANNCTDRTAEIARRYPVTVLEMPHNPDKKAGALNHGWRETARDADLVLTMDADTVLLPDTVAEMAGELRANAVLGAVCARYWASPGKGLVWRLQRLEYTRYDDLRDLRRWRVSVASGAAAMYRNAALEAVAAAREAGEPWDGSSLIEDYALTLELKARGYRVAAARKAHVYTTPPGSFRELWVQRLRWGRGGMDECLKRGWSTATRQDCLSYVLFGFSVFFRVLFLTMLTLMIVYAVPFRYALIGLIPLGVMWLERVTSMWRLPGRSATDVALVAVLVVEDFYGFFLELCAVVAAWRCLNARRQAW
ncbi:glycosyltransferase family 2 protein [Actinomycetospora lutea]|uniref:glycosyltransferase n=1 Tax=Actinomycetospora lutea TaxID=663604 RepID=UPI002365798F|nr:glycosyltransferase family 2 protein [Actinomycetospora lutea]MDD7937010.1 glycosyltransferase family 2 protein [Actinomycetospora lutea]